MNTHAKSGRERSEMEDSQPLAKNDKYREL
jgi:hypothetical protein